MKPIFSLISLGLLGLLAACGKPSFVVQDGEDMIQKSFVVEKTDPNLDYRNTYVIEMPNQAPVLVGSLNARDIELTLNSETHTYRLTGTYEILGKGKTANKISTKSFDLSGDSQGEHPNLYPNFDDGNQSERVRARLTCLNEEDGACSKVILDLIVKKTGYKENLAVQFEVDLETKTSVEQKPAPEEKLKEVQPPAPVKTEASPAPTPSPSPSPSPTPAPDKTPSPAPPAPKVETPENKTPPKHEPTVSLNNEKPEVDEDDDEQGGLYVGTLYQDTDQLFMNGDSKVEGKGATTPSPSPDKKETTPTPAPVGTTPSPIRPAPPKTSGNEQGRIRDQAVGSAARGHLENPSSLKTAIQSRQAHSVQLLYPARERFYGTWEMIDSIEKMSSFLSQKDNLPGYIMAVGDISQKSGGPLVGSAHKSHQCGLDADIAYPMSNLRSLAFLDLVSNGSVSPTLRLRETYQLFEFAQTSLRNVDRIFVDAKIKKALCDMAQKQGMIASGRAIEVLRRLRPAEGHDNHFHLRIRCSPQQPRCRMMAEPPAGSGCDALR